MGKTNLIQRNNIINTFNRCKWNELTDKIKRNHGVDACKAWISAEKFRIPLSYFPIHKSDVTAKKKAEDAGLFRPVNQQIVQATKKGISEMNRKYKAEYSTTFESTCKLVNISTERQRRVDLAQEMKENIEEQWKGTAVVR